MTSLEQYVANRFKTFYDLLAGGKQFYSELGDCYGQLSEAYYGSLGLDFVKKESDTYEQLLNPEVIELAYFLYKKSFLGSNIDERYPKLKTLLNELNGGSKNAGDFGIDAVSRVSKASIQEAMQNFGANGEDDLSDLDLSEFDDYSGESEDVAGFEGAFNDDDFDLDEFNNLGNKDLDNNEGTDNTLKEEEVKRDLEFTDESQSDKDLFDTYNKAWGGLLDKSIGNLKKRLRALYASGFSGIISEPYGLLTNQGVIKAYSSKKLIARRENSDPPSDIMLYRGVIQSMQVASNGKFVPFREIGAERPQQYKDETTGNMKPYNELMDSSVVDLELLSNPAREIFYNFHAKIAFGYFETCDGLQKYLKENSKSDIDYSRARRALSYDDLEGYIIREIKKIAYHAYKAAGVTYDSVDQNLISKVNNINTNLIAAISNVILIPEQKKDAYTEIRISTMQPIDTNVLISQLQDALQQKVEKIKTYDCGVIAIRVVYDEKETNEASLFAKDTLQGIIDTGIPISWSNALLGKNLQGEPLFWKDFKEDAPSKRVYCVYAESRAGKGIMTSTLLCNALSNGYKLLYIDGKAENGIGTGKMAWKYGKEAAIYNGFNKRAEPYNQPLEYYTNGLRSIEQAFSSIDSIPEGIFTQKQKEQFVGLCTYIRGLQLVAELIDKRASEVGKDPDDWVVAVFDEFRQMVNIEKTCREAIIMRATELGAKFDKNLQRIVPKSTSNKNKDQENTDKWGGDSTLQWIDGWFNWLKDVASLFVPAVTMSIGKANINLFVIFQGSDWFESEGSGTFLCEKVLEKLDSTKIVGRQGVSGKGGNSKYGDGNAANYPWVQYINSHPGQWAITHASSMKQCGSDSSVTIFKPFNVFLEPKSGREGELADASKRERYLEPYLEKMFSGLGKTNKPGDVLNEGFVYFDNFVKENGLGADLNSFMYNAHDFATTMSSGSSENYNDTSAHMYDAPDASMNESEAVDFGDVDPFSNNDNTVFEPSTPFKQNSQNQSMDDFMQQKVNQATRNYNNPQTQYTGTSQSNMGYGTSEEYDRELENQRQDDEDYRKLLSQFEGFKPTSDMHDTSKLDDFSKGYPILEQQTEHYEAIITRYTDMCEKDCKEQAYGWDKSKYNLDNDGTAYDYASQAGLDALNAGYGAQQAEIYEETAKRCKAIIQFYRKIAIREGNDASSNNANAHYGYNQSGQRVDAGYEVVHNTGNSRATRFGGPDEGYATFFASDLFCEKFNLNPNNSFIVTASDYGRMGVASKLMQTLKGADYEFKSRWDYILRAVTKAQRSAATVVDARIMSDGLMFNKRVVATIGLVGGEDGIELEDIVRFIPMAKKFPNIKNIEIDYNIYTASTAELGDHPINALFTIFPKLTRVAVWNVGYGTAPDVFNRNDYNRDQNMKKMQEREAEARLRNGIDTISNATNPHFQSRSPVSKYRASARAATLASGGWNVAKSQFEKGNFVRGSAAAVFAGVTGTLSLGMHGIGSLFGKFGR